MGDIEYSVLENKIQKAFKMKNLIFSFFVMFFVAQAAHAQIAASIAVSIAQALIGLHSFDDGTKVPFLGETCTAKLKGRIRKFKWVWDSKFSCDGRFGGLTGSSRGSKSRTGAVERAIEDFAKQALANGSLKPEDLAQIG